MPATRLNTFSHCRLGWLLWLVLLLPVAQTAATWHVLSHAASGQAKDDAGRQAIQHEHCDLCLSAAALTGGGPLISASRLALATGRHEAPPDALHSLPLMSPARAYDSRAPPFLLH